MSKKENSVLVCGRPSIEELLEWARKEREERKFIKDNKTQNSDIERLAEKRIKDNPIILTETIDQFFR